LLPKLTIDLFFRTAESIDLAEAHYSKARGAFGAVQQVLE
jgi:hypothetical protein